MINSDFTATGKSGRSHGKIAPTVYVRSKGQGAGFDNDTAVLQTSRFSTARTTRKKAK